MAVPWFSDLLIQNHSLLDQGSPKTSSTRFRAQYSTPVKPLEHVGASIGNTVVFLNYWGSYRNCMTRYGSCGFWQVWLIASQIQKSAPTHCCLKTKAASVHRILQESHWPVRLYTQPALMESWYVEVRGMQYGSEILYCTRHTCTTRHVLNVPNLNLHQDPDGPVFSDILPLPSGLQARKKCHLTFSFATNERSEASMTALNLTVRQALQTGAV